MGFFKMKRTKTSALKILDKHESFEIEFQAIIVNSIFLITR